MCGINYAVLQLDHRYINVFKRLNIPIISVWINQIHPFRFMDIFEKPRHNLVLTQKTSHNLFNIDPDTVLFSQRIELLRHYQFFLAVTEKSNHITNQKKKCI